MLSTPEHWNSSGKKARWHAAAQNICRMKITPPTYIWTSSAFAKKVQTLPAPGGLVSFAWGSR